MNKYAVLAMMFLFCTGSFAESDHLVPVPPYDPSGYNNAVFQSLIVNGAANAYMISYPSFSPEEAVIIYAEAENLKKNGFLVGAIRQPTVKVAIIRLIAKIDINEDDLTKVCNLLKDSNVNK